MRLRVFVVCGSLEDPFLLRRPSLSPRSPPPAEGRIDLDLVNLPVCLWSPVVWLMALLCFRDLGIDTTEYTSRSTYNNQTSHLLLRARRLLVIRLLFLS
jgi:hypothetical protein